MDYFDREVVQETGDLEDCVMSQKAVTSELRRERLSAINAYYPYAYSNSISQNYSKEIVELYIDPLKYTSGNIKIRTLRSNQIGVDWSGNRTELVINDGTFDILSSTRFNIETSTAEFIHN